MALVDLRVPVQRVVGSSIGLELENCPNSQPYAFITKSQRFVCLLEGLMGNVMLGKLVRLGMAKK